MTTTIRLLASVACALALSAYADTCSYTDSDGDGIPDVNESPPSIYVRDNPVLFDNLAFSRQLYRDLWCMWGYYTIPAGGPEAWAAQITNGSNTRDGVINSFVRDSKFEASHGPVTRLYRATFLRTPDYGGFMFWLDQLQSGAWTLDGIAEFFSGSAEFQQRYGTLTNDGYVRQLYRNVLGREGDPGGIAFWTSELDFGRRTRGNVLNGFAQSLEYQIVNANSVMIIGLYKGLLLRVPTDSELSTELASAAAGNLIPTISRLRFSSEYAARFATAAAPQPRLIEATTYTTSDCPDRYCVKLRGFNFASNSYVQVYRGSTALGALTPTHRYRDGDADVVQVRLDDPAMRGAVDAESPPFGVAIVNPGTIPTSDGPKQAFRRSGLGIYGWTDSYAYLGGDYVVGWVCPANIDNKGPTPLYLEYEELSGTPTRTFLKKIFARTIARPDVAAVVPQCGGDTNSGFLARWPDRLFDGATRMMYVSADAVHIANVANPSTVLLGNSPLRVTFPLRALRAEFVSMDLPAQMVVGVSTNVVVTFRNVGSTTWPASSIRLGPQSPQDNSNWGIGRVSLPTDVAPGASVRIAFSVIAQPTAKGQPFTWQLVQDGGGWFGEVTSSSSIPVYDCLGGATCLVMTPNGATPANLRPPGPPPSSLVMTVPATIYPDF